MGCAKSSISREREGLGDSSKYVINVLYRLGVVRRKRLHGLTLVYASKDLLEESCKRIGVTISYNIPREHLPYPSHPSPEEWKEVFGKA